MFTSESGYATVASRGVYHRLLTDRARNAALIV
jgi:hypothetical protein